MSVGPNGEDVSASRITAALWKPTDKLNLNALAIVDLTNGWAVGPKGTIAHYVEHASIR